MTHKNKLPVEKSCATCSKFRYLLERDDYSWYCNDEEARFSRAPQFAHPLAFGCKDWHKDEEDNKRHCSDCHNLFYRRDLHVWACPEGRTDMYYCTRCDAALRKLMNDIAEGMFGKKLLEE